MDLNKVDTTMLVEHLNKLNKDDFFKFLANSTYPSQLDLTMNPRVLHNMEKLFEKLDKEHIRGESFDCELKDKDQFPKVLKKCHFPEVISRANTIKKIGADSVNGIVFNIRLGNFSFLVKKIF